MLTIYKCLLVSEATALANLNLSKGRRSPRIGIMEEIIPRSPEMFFKIFSLAGAH
jgi:hypothetical protein